MPIQKALYVLLAVIILGGGYFSWNTYVVQNTPAPILKSYKIGIIVNSDIHLPNVEGFKDTMTELGYIEGKNVEYVFRHAKNQPELRTQYMEEILATNPDLILTLANQTASDLKKKNLNIPVVFLDMDPSPLVQNLKNPEANLTGTSAGFLEFAGKRLELLKEMNPSIKRVIVTPDEKFPTNPKFMKVIRDAAQKLDIALVEFPMSSFEEFQKKLPEILTRKNGDAFIFFPGPNNTVPTGPGISKDLRKIIINQLKKEKLPSINHNLEFGANEGVLMSYGNYRRDVGKEGALMTDKILKGTPVRDISVATPLKSLVLEINLKTAEEIGIVIPKETLAGASKTYKE